MEGKDSFSLRRMRVISVAMLAIGCVGIGYSIDQGVPHLWRFELFVATAAVGGLALLTASVLTHIGMLMHVYSMGYRHGRHDADTSLMEQGVWLSAASERRTREQTGGEDWL